MVNVTNTSADRAGGEFIPPEYLPAGMDENYLRNEQLGGSIAWRPLRADEIETLRRNRNICADWGQLLVGERFDARQIRDSEFCGLVRIAGLEEVTLEYHELRMPAGITHSRIIACDIGKNVAIHGVRYLGHYIVGERVMLLNIDEMHTSNHAKFGNGIIKDGESEPSRGWMELINESGTRAVMPFEGMTCADAYIWAKYRDDAALQTRLGEITQKQFDSRRGFYGTVGDDCVIKNSRVIKDVRFGAACYINGANKLKNLTIRSSELEPTHIGEGVELVDGIVGLGCRIFYGCKAVRFVMGGNCELKYGARLIHCYLGDNSTVACCELLHNLIFPAHEQHHNNSFLIASLVMGQSNIAAGATIGSNHNSRAADGEIQAGRGFWPGLCVSVKHYCRFASYVLLAKGDYPSELDIALPFSLVSDDRAKDRLLVIPAYWWTYNMYALARNTWKFATRDKRKTRGQHIETDALAPDTAEEILAALALLELWVGKAQLRAGGRPADSIGLAEAVAAGRGLLMAGEDGTGQLQVLGENMEDSSRPVVILKAHKAYNGYREMLHYYAVKNLLDYMDSEPAATRGTMVQALSGPRKRCWVNLGGQLAPEAEVTRLLEDIKAGQLSTWDQIHQRYDETWRAYPRQKQAHGLACVMELLEISELTPELWNAALDKAADIQKHVRNQVYASRKKDFDDPFRQTTFRNKEEMRAVVGTAEESSFAKQVQRDTDVFCTQVEAVRARG